MAAVAEGLVRGVPAPAQCDGSTARQAEIPAGGIENLEFAFDANGAVVEARHFYGWHT